jgi:phospholipid/cholesterol/gamma-HCH transport system substrate-binding protein
MNNTQQTARVGLFFLLGIALVWVAFETLSGSELFKHKGYSLVASFDNLEELKAGDEVRMAGVKIGTIDKTRLDLGGRRAQAILLIDRDIKIANDATASIVMAGLLGGNYIGVEIGSPNAPALEDGAEIKTKVTPDINAIMTELGGIGTKLDGALGSIAGMMNGDGKGGVGGLFQKLDKLVTDNSEKVGTTLTNVREISDKINRGQGTLGKLINDSTLHDQLLAAVGDIKTTANEARGFMDNANSIVAQVKSGQGPLGVLLYDQQTATDIKTSVANIRGVSDKLARGEGTLGKLINDDSLYTTAKGTLNKVDRTLDGLNDSGPITAVGILANSLF